MPTTTRLTPAIQLRTGIDSKRIRVHPTLTSPSIMPTNPTESHPRSGTNESLWHVHASPDLHLPLLTFICGRVLDVLLSPHQHFSYSKIQDKYHELYSSWARVTTLTSVVALRSPLVLPAQAWVYRYNIISNMPSYILKAFCRMPLKFWNRQQKIVSTSFVKVHSFP